MILKRGQKDKLKKLVWPMILFIFLLLVIFIIPPANIFIVTAVMALIGFLNYMFVSIFFTKKMATVAAITIFLTFWILALGLMDRLNFILLVSLVTALTIFLHQK